MKNIVIIDGGTGLSTVLRGMKQIENIDLTAIATMTDDGGGTGRIRHQLHTPTMGDVRNVMCAMAGGESIFTSLMNYQFNKECDDVGGRSLRDLILTAMTKTAGGFMEAIRTFSKFPNVKGQVISSSLQIITLYTVMEDGTIVRGGGNIPDFNNRIEKVFYQQHMGPTRETLQTAHEADAIVYGIGGLYTSIMPNLTVDGVAERLRSDPIKEIYFCNAMTQPGEAGSLTLEDHVAAIQGHSFSEAVDIVIIHNNRAQRHILKKYKDMESKSVRVAQEEHSYQTLYRDVLSLGNDLIRHNSDKIRDVLGKAINSKDE